MDHQDLMNKKLYLSKTRSKFASIVDCGGVFVCVCSGLIPFWERAADAALCVCSVVDRSGLRSVACAPPAL